MWLFSKIKHSNSGFFVYFVCCTLIFRLSMFRKFVNNHTNSAKDCQHVSIQICNEPYIQIYYQYPIQSICNKKIESIISAYDGISEGHTQSINMNNLTNGKEGVKRLWVIIYQWESDQITKPPTDIHTA